LNAIIFKGNYIPAAFCLLAVLYLFLFIVSFILVLRWLSHRIYLAIPSLYEGNSQLSALPVLSDCLQLVY